MTSIMTAQPLWTPSDGRRAAANLRRFEAFLAGRVGAAPKGFRQVQAFSLAQPENFWDAVWEFCKVKASAKGKRVIAHPGRMPHAGFFPDAALNYAENVLSSRTIRRRLSSAPRTAPGLNSPGGSSMPRSRSSNRHSPTSA